MGGYKQLQTVVKPSSALLRESLCLRVKIRLLLRRTPASCILPPSAFCLLPSAFCLLPSSGFHPSSFLLPLLTLYLLRHAEAEDHAATDSARPLTPHGLEQARAVATFCQRHGLRPDLVLTSPYRRTVQTAELVAAAFDQTPQPAPFLASGMHPADALDELRAYDRFDSLLLVGHQPDLGLLIAALLGLESEETFPVGKASLTGLEVHRLSPGGGSLRFFLPASLMQ